MSSVLRLIQVYFTGSAFTRWFTLAGLMLIAVSIYVVVAVEQTEHMLAFAFIGLVAFFLGSALMPITVSRLSQSHGLVIMPGVRVKLLISIYLTVLLVALPAGLLTPLAYVAGMSADISLLRTDPHLRAYTFNLALLTYTSACTTAAWLYVFMWLVTSERSFAGVAKGMIVAVALTYLPSRDFHNLGETITWNLRVIATTAMVFGAGFLLWPRWKSWRAGKPVSRTGLPAIRDVTGREIDLVLGNANPWLYIAALTVPILLTSRLSQVNVAIWLLYLTVASIIAGATAGQSAERSHALWLRGDWSRRTLFDAVETSTWRHNGLVLTALIVFLLLVGGLMKIDLATMATTLPLLILGTTLSTYLGLMLTRGVRVPEAILGAVAMLTLMHAALNLAGHRPDYSLISALIATLGGLCAVLRLIARRRWERIDWLLCRPDRNAEARRA